MVWIHQESKKAMPSITSAKSQRGFTLVEVMLVIVMMAIMASLVVMNIQGIDQRKVMQARDQLELNLQRIRLESTDQGRILGLMVQAATDSAPATYEVVEYLPQSNTAKNQNTNDFLTLKTSQWQKAEGFSPQELPPQTNLTIQMLDSTVQLDALKTNRNELPQVIWLGNGQVIPATFQLYWQQQPIGDVLQLNRMGSVVKNEI